MMPTGPAVAAVTLSLLLQLAPAAPARAAGRDHIEPGPNLHLVDVPPIPVELAERVRPYTELRGASFRGWHPERREMLIATRFGDTEQVHRVERPGGARRQITFFREPVGSASYDPRDGRSIVLSRDTGGDEFYQLYRHELASGRTVLLTDGVERHFAGPWSNRGDRIAFVKVDADAEGAFTEIHVMDPSAVTSSPEATAPRAAPGGPQGRPATDDAAGRPNARNRPLATQRGGGWSVADWSPDDRHLLLVDRLSSRQSSLWLLEVASGALRRVTPDPGAGPVAWDGGRFSADGSTVFVTTDLRGEFRQLAALRLEPQKPGSAASSREPEILTADIPWDVNSVELSQAGDTLAFLTNEGGASRLYLLDVRSRRRRAVDALPLGVAGDLRWHRNGRDLALTLSSARSSVDVWVVDAPSGRVERWTESETGGLDATRFVEPTEIGWTSFDGRRISGWLYQPDAVRFPGRRPVIVDIHGGPEGQERPSFRGADNVWTSELGIAVLYPNVRGSTGYGKSFVALDDGFSREGSYEDIRALLDWIGSNPHLDADRVMVTGGSYGGHMTFAVATRYSDRIRCSVPVVGISNLRTFLENTQGYRRDLRRVEYGDERDPRMREFLERIAPLNHAGDITKPILVVHGRNDPRVPWTESDQIVRAVRANGVPAWYLIAEDEGHGFKKKSNRSFELYTTVLFAERCLLTAQKSAG